MADTPLPQGWTRTLLVLRPALLLVGVAIAVAAGVTAVLWSRGATQAVLYTGLGDREASAVAESLRGAGFDVQMGPGAGVIQVPESRLMDARMHLAGAGVSVGQGGMDVLDAAPGFGVSSFLEGARYQHALEQELARTIGGLRGIASARVHLAMSKPSAFIRDRVSTTASVVLELMPGAQLAAGQADAIARLVASSIPELKPESVTVVDARGGLLSQSDPATLAAQKHFDLARRTEEILVNRVQTLLLPLVGRAEVQVMVELDRTENEQARETVDPNAVMTQEQVSRESRGMATANSGPGGIPGGVPGAASNLPGEAAPVTTAGGSSGNAAETSSQERRQYEVSREMAYSRTASGRIQRLTVAVLLDHPPIAAGGAAGAPPAADGAVDPAALTPPVGEAAPATEWSAATLADVEALVMNAVGYSEARGDSLTVRQAAFRPMEVPEIAPMLWWQQAWVLNSAREAGGLLLLALIVFLALRPLLKNLTDPAPLRRLLAPAVPQALPSGASDIPRAPVTLEGPAALTFDDKMALARQAVAQDPKRVAQVVKTWVGNDG
ncbi:flagellar M-ring protein FliF [Flagellatimonas centrodinii]|uniref:flagellar basal-body MS-ring/collar protein FliF n=1 Tax=Flagellatimonas centrodinii TaxID=2806210 RepID=UPI001FEF149D|nr:flagellar basal-body MS-ring/collar protein FliF [Flagellatimonas centrodinii]ULQ45641.1 flagellar M-ring protein FliF [Flagellatimonas centrodinii]